MSQISVNTSPQSCTTDDSSCLENEVPSESSLACSPSNKMLSSSNRPKKRSYSDTEDDLTCVSKFTPRKSKDSTDTSSCLRFLYKFRTSVNINLRCVIFNCEIGKAHDFYIAWMVRVTLSDACLKCCFSISNLPSIRGRRSLPANVGPLYLKPATEILNQPSLTGQINRRESYPFQISPRTPSNRSFHQSCTTDQTPYSPVNTGHRRKRLKTVLPYYNPSDLITFKSDQGFIDSHCHLDFLFQRQGYEGSYLDYQKKHRETFPESYKGCVAIFCNPYSFNKKHLWQNYLEEENVWASFGCHPHNAKDYNDEVEESLRTALTHHKVRALGEIGLDYSTRNNCMRKSQHEAFRRQLKIAIEKKLPLVIHCREAHEDAMAIMKEIVPKEYFIHLHCFTDTWEWASKWLQEFPNLFIGITNVVTYPTAETVHEVAKKIPLQRLLLETDAPYFVPRPLSKEYPGTRFSHPGMAIHVAAQIAALKGGVPLELVLYRTRKNTKTVYNI